MLRYTYIFAMASGLFVATDASISGIFHMAALVIFEVGLICYVHSVAVSKDQPHV